jgi:glycosyltransferase involved in cell wall biosynthesis
MKFAVTIATYQRKDGKTPELLKRALDSVFNQTHQDFRIFIVGDNYEDNTEFNEIISQYPQDKIYAVNLPESYDRLKYKGVDSENLDFDTDRVLWCNSGRTPMNIGIELALHNGYDWVAHLDHDDFWEPTHLQFINNVIEQYGHECIWITTQATFGPNDIMPIVETNGWDVVYHLPRGYNVIHSAVAMSMKRIPFRYRDVWDEDGKLVPTDADFWDRLGSFIPQNGYTGTYINALTCRHDSEGEDKY